MEWVYIATSMLLSATGGDAVETPRCFPARVEAVEFDGPKRTRFGWGHELVFEIEVEGDPSLCQLEWWEYVSFEGSDWVSPSVYAHPSVRETTWQDHRDINASSSTWRAWERRGTATIVRMVDRPSIPLGNVRLGPSRDYANLTRKLLIEVRVLGRDRDGRERATSAYVFQSLSEREGVPNGGLISSGPSNFKSVVAEHAPR